MRWGLLLGNLPSIPVLWELLPYLTLDTLLPPGWEGDPQTPPWWLNPDTCSWTPVMLPPFLLLLDLPHFAPCRDTSIIPLEVLMRPGLPVTMLPLWDEERFSQHQLWDLLLSFKSYPSWTAPSKLCWGHVSGDTTGSFEELVCESPGTDCVECSHLCCICSENATLGSVQAK